MKKGSSLKGKVQYEEVTPVWVYVLLLSAVTIFTFVLGKFPFSIGKASLTVAIFAYPFRYFIANIITKKYGYNETFLAITYSTCLLLLFAVASSLLYQQEIDYLPLTGEVIGYLTSQIVNLIFYYYLFINTDNNKLALLATYIFAMLLDNFMNMIFASRMVLADSFWRTYIVTILIQSSLSIILILFDHKKIKTTRKLVR